MIAQLLNPETLRTAARRLAEQTSAEARSLHAGNPLAEEMSEESEVTGEDLQEVKGRLEDFYTEEAVDLAGANEPLWIPRAPLASLILSAYEEFFWALGLAREAAPGQGLARLASPVPETELDPEALEFISGQQRFGGRWFTRFGERDVRYLSWGAAAVIGKLLRGQRRTFPENPPEPFPIGNNDRVLLVSDWGSGIPRAQQVATAMRASLRQALQEGRRCHVIHLGDTYYTGRKSEYDRRFLAHWPVYAGDDKAQTSSWCLNANHDMYSGGYDYFDYLLCEARFQRQGESSYFSLENDHWQLLGLDSAYDPADLHGGQVAWAFQQRAAAPQKAGVLLTHHQPFSAFEESKPAMLDRLRPLLENGGFLAWFWGHEHRGALYAPREGIAYPRLIGHGGVPVWAPQGPPPGGVLYEFGRDRDGLEWTLAYNEKFLRLGFAELTFDKERLDIRYVTERGDATRSESLTAHA